MVSVTPKLCGFGEFGALRFSFLVFADMAPHYRKNKRIENGAALMEQMPSLQLAVRLGFACQA